MPKNHPDLEEARTLHQTGQLEEAAASYLRILRKNPRHVETLHLLAVLRAQQENFTDAITHLETAIRYQPNHLTLQLHLANMLKLQGLFTQAAERLQKLIAQHPTYAPAFNNLGTVYYAQAKLTEAIAAYQEAIELQPEYVDAYYNLGLALTKHNAEEAAIATYQKLLQLAPEHFAAQFQLACILAQAEKTEEALTLFAQIEKTHPYHFETQTNLASCYLKQGALGEAKTHYLKALDLMPQDSQILFNLGVISAQQGQLDHAIQYYQQAVRIQPDFFAAHNNLGVAFLVKQHAGFALQHFQAAARLQPDNIAIRYTLEVLAQNKNLLAAPIDYIKSLFDSYADHYEPHLLTALDYKIPAQLYTAVLEVCQPPKAQWDILDLGCGTGLCGLPFKDAAKSLTGIDVAEKMLAVARAKNIYTHLENTEINSFLQDKNHQYDLILAGDVLVYIGELQTILQRVSIALRPRGLFVFNAEMNAEQEYQMNQSGRFSHRKDYLEKLAEAYGLQVEYYQVVVTRLQNNAPVYGHLYVLQRQK